MMSYNVERNLINIRNSLRELPISNDVGQSIMSILLACTGGQLRTERKADNVMIDKAKVAAIFYRASLKREEVVGNSLIYDPVWLIMLDLFMAAEEGRPTTIAAATAASRVPSTSALRILGKMEQQGFIRRVEMLGDRRKVYVEPCDKTIASVATVIDQVTGTMPLNMSN